MTSKQQCIALYTLVRRELVRMFRIFSQVFLPPVITTVLYFLIFGEIIGRRIGDVEGIPYALFIAPGLVMMAVIVNAYSNVSTSLFTVRFQKSIEELLVSPMHYSLILIGYTIGGVLRAIVVATLIFLIATFFVALPFAILPQTLLIVSLVAFLFALCGFTNGMLARNFDDVAIVPTFVLTPLTYLGGVFYTTKMLPPFWETVSHFNPVLYMVNALRYVMIGYDEVRFSIALTLIVIMCVILFILNLILLKKGIGLRD